jgi:hypothetical protein
MQLAQLKQAGLIEVRRAGQKSLYRMAAAGDGTLTEVLRKAGGEIAEGAQDDRGLRLILSKRKDKLRAYFDELAGRFGRNYVPGRSWKGLSEMFLMLMPRLVVADLGAGEGHAIASAHTPSRAGHRGGSLAEDDRLRLRNRAAKRRKEPRVPLRAIWRNFR